MQPAQQNYHNWRNEPQPHRERVQPGPSDTGELRMALGTRVRLHSYHHEALEVGLTDIVGVSSWNDVVSKVMQGHPFVITAIDGSQRVAFAGGVILWAEALPREAA